MNYLFIFIYPVLAIVTESLCLEFLRGNTSEMIKSALELMSKP